MVVIVVDVEVRRLAKEPLEGGHGGETNVRDEVKQVATVLRDWSERIRVLEAAAA
jgi:hypothetical protein